MVIKLLIPKVLEVTVLLLDPLSVFLSIQVFFDEINTSSNLGLFKEMIVDRTFNGEVIPNICSIILY